MADEPVDTTDAEKNPENKEDEKALDKDGARPESKASVGSKADEEKKTAPRVKSAKAKKESKKAGGKGI